MGAMALDFAAVAAIPQAAPKRDLTGLNKRLWLLLYAEGGRWTAMELCDRLRMKGREIHPTLREMVDTGFLLRHPFVDEEGRASAKFSVTDECKVPRGVLIKEIQAVMMFACPVVKQ
jgi:hypothetical protein